MSLQQHRFKDGLTNILFAISIRTQYLLTIECLVKSWSRAILLTCSLLKNGPRKCSLLLKMQRAVGVPDCNRTYWRLYSVEKSGYLGDTFTKLCNFLGF